ncbi:MAG TPA: hypothetical protein DDY14_00015 [Chromatiaceae bacterium]|nr:hypothetical protein [Chromatiaceae bacterium]
MARAACGCGTIHTAGLPKPGPDAFGRIEPQPGDRLYCLMVRRQIEVALLALPYLYRDQDFGLGAMLRAFDPQGCVHIAGVRHVPDPDNPEWRFLVPHVDPRDRAAFDAFYQHALVQVAALPERPAGRDLREALGLNPDPRGRRLGLGWIRDMWPVWRETDAAIRPTLFLDCTYPISDHLAAIIFTARHYVPSIREARPPAEFDDAASRRFTQCPSSAGDPAIMALVRERSDIVPRWDPSLLER